MHKLTQKILTANPRYFGVNPIIVALLELGAAATLPERSRPVRRRMQMRMLRQWERLEEEIPSLVEAQVTDEDLVREAEKDSVEPFYLPNSGWLAPGTDAVNLRFAIRALLMRTIKSKLKASTMMKAPLHLEDQFNAVVTSSEIAGSPLDKFLRGSLRSSTALARLLSEVKEHLDNEGEPPSEDTIKECEAALISQGFTH